MTESFPDKIENQKSKIFRQNSALDNVLKELYQILSPVQREKEAKFNKNKWPICFIVGNPRSGSTLLLQWLASLGHFSYPTNILNRFAYAPYIGALVQELLFNPKYDFHNEFSDLNSETNFNSDLGKSEGALASNEFQHFFRNYMPNFDPEFLDEKKINKVDFHGIKNGLASIENAFGKPFVTKAVMLQFNISQLYSVIPNTIFFYIKREPIFNMQSILFARKKYYNNRNIWWSVKPKEYYFLKDMDYFHQIAGQVFFTNKSISKSLKNIPKHKIFELTYEDFCNSPKNIFDELVETYRKNNFIIESPYSGIKFFKVRNSIKLHRQEIDKLEKAYEYFKNDFKKIKFI